MTSEAERLESAFAEAFSPYVTELLEDRGVEIDPSVEESITEGRRLLARDLHALLALPASQQDRSPLELFREALGPLTKVLELKGEPHIARDSRSRALLPEDVYDLAPASSQSLSREAWEAHLAWGVAKASELGDIEQNVPKRPSVLLVSRDLMDRSKVEAAATASGYELVVVLRFPTDEQSPPARAAIAFVDLENPDADDAVRSFAAAGVRTIAYGPHVDDIAITRALTLGATDAVTRGRFFADVGRYLPALV